jgi:hypothetical protein
MKVCKLATDEEHGDGEEHGDEDLGNYEDRVVSPPPRRRGTI